MEIDKIKVELHLIQPKSFIHARYSSSYIETSAQYINQTSQSLHRKPIPEFDKEFEPTEYIHGPILGEEILPIDDVYKNEESIEDIGDIEGIEYDMLSIDEQKSSIDKAKYILDRVLIENAEHRKSKSIPQMSINSTAPMAIGSENCLINKFDVQKTSAIETEWDMANQKFCSECDSISFMEDRITFQVAYLLIQENMINQIKVPDPIYKEAQMCNCFGKEKKMPHTLEKEKNVILDFQYIDFSSQNIVHRSILNTVYRSISAENALLLGCKNSHLIDALKKNGVVSLLLLLNMIESHPIKTKELYGKGISEISFFKACLECTSICMSVLERGLLNKECAKNGSVMNVVNLCFWFCMNELFHKKWKSKSEFKQYCTKNIAQMNKVLGKLI